MGVATSPTRHVRGRVVRGRGEGRTIGYPTANLQLAGGSSRPEAGIYACWVERVDGSRQPGILVSGVAWDEPELPRQEVYLLDWTSDLYDEDLLVEVVKKIREVIEFAELEALRRQIEDDISAARRLLQL